MIGALTNHLWQSTLFTFAAWLVAAALRKNGAHVRHRIWFVASLKFLVPFSLLMSLGSALPAWTPATTAVAAQAARELSVTVDQIVQPFTDDAFVPSAPTAPSNAATRWAPMLIGGVWACGFVVVLLVRLRDWRGIRAAVRVSVPVALPVRVPVRASAGLLEPGVVGLFRPVLLVPAGIEQQLTPRQLDAVLAHELCHVTRRDNLTSAMHMVVEAAFWFHPLVWWVGARLVDERERACDEHVLRVCGEPQAYAEGILNVCKLYVESPLACVSGVSGADLKKRIAAIMINRVELRLTLARKAGLVVVATLAVGLPLLAGMLIAPVRASAFAQAAADAAAPASQNFDVASVKPCESTADVAFGRRGGGGAGRPAPAGEPAGASASSGRLFLHCETLEVLIEQAYFGQISRHSYVTGGPAWMKSDRYDVEAKAEGAPSAAVLRGPMLQALLKDRFKLALHRETREMPVYALTTAQSGSKLSPLPEGSCAPATSASPAGATGGADPHGCGTTDLRYSPSNNQLGGYGLTAGEFVKLLDNFAGLDRSVVDKTGLTGVFDFHLRYAPDGAPVEAEAAPSIFTAVQQQLGLRLDAVKGPGEFLVIDHVEKPRPDDPAPARAGGARPMRDHR
jgi:bla regulator protein BlaR1